MNADCTGPLDRRALFISAPASGQGKTTVTAGLARAARNAGLRVRVFKTGPDFLDPMILERASGAPVYQLDLWMGGVAHCRGLLRQAAEQADLLLLEGVMGLHDGEPSSAHLALSLGISVAVVIDAGAMAQTFGALALGLREYRAGLEFHGVIANRVAGSAHARMLAESLTVPAVPMRLLGTLPDDAGLAIPERYLGLRQALEIADLETRLERAAAAVSGCIALDTLPQARFAAEPGELVRRMLPQVRVAVARDAALSFIYPANLDLLAAMGAEVRFFSPLHDPLPEADSVYLPGGYPELYAQQLSSNRALLEGLRAHGAAGKPILAECGGMMLLFEHLLDVHGASHPMAALLPGEVRMQPSLQAISLQSVEFEQGALRGHSFHYSRLATPLTPTAHGRTQRGASGEPVFQRGRITASYVHFYWPSNALALAQLLEPGDRRKRI